MILGKAIEKNRLLGAHLAPTGPSTGWRFGCNIERGTLAHPEILSHWTWQNLFSCQLGKSQGSFKHSSIRLECCSVFFLSAGPCQATNGMRGGIERGPCRASGVGVKVVSKNRLPAKRDLKFRTFARQDVLPIHMPHRPFLEGGGLRFQSELTGANFTWFFPESSQSNLRILVQVKLSSFTKVMMGEHH